jgi:hypothetical protein
MQSAVGFIGVDIPRPRPRTAHGAKLYRPSGTATERPKADTAFWRADPDVLLMERVRDGDMEAFQVLFTKYSYENRCHGVATSCGFRPLK